MKGSKRFFSLSLACLSTTVGCRGVDNADLSTRQPMGDDDVSEVGSPGPSLEPSPSPSPVQETSTPLTTPPETPTPTHTSTPEAETETPVEPTPTATPGSSWTPPPTATPIPDSPTPLESPAPSETPTPDPTTASPLDLSPTPTGEGSPTPTAGLDGDGDGFSEEEDCDDTDASIHPVLVDSAALAGGNGSYDAPFQTVQEGVNAPSSCGEVWVRLGTYVENVTISQGRDGDGGHLLVKGLGDAADVVISGSAGNRALVIFDSAGIELQDLTLMSRDAVSISGGAVSVDISESISFRRVIVRDTQVTEGNSGGGMWVDDSTDILLDDVQFLRNLGSLGGGLAVMESDVQIVDGVFQQNEARVYGGGIYLGESETGTPTRVVMNGGSISQNKAGTTGGGGFSKESQIFELYDVVLLQNYAVAAWAAAAFNPTHLERCQLIENYTDLNLLNYAGGVKLRDPAVVRNNLFVHNVSAYGGAIDLYDYEIETRYEIYNNTFVDNLASSGNGSAIYFFTVDSLILGNNIFVDSGLGNSDSQLYSSAFGYDVLFDTNDFYFAEGSLALGTGNIGEVSDDRSNTLYVDPLFEDYLPGDYSSFDLRLSRESTLRDAGSSSYGYDWDGTPPDLGAYGGPHALQ